MAKGKQKQITGANSVAVKNRATDNASKPGADALPPMEESAFAGLRQKIEQRLKDGAAKQKSKNNKSKSAPAGDAKNSKDNSTKSNSNQSNSDKNVKGKKRDRNGEVIAREQNKGGITKQEKPKASKKSDDDETLRQEILAMGGTEEDLDLLAGVDSESEVEGESGKVDDDLRKQLSSMLEASGHVAPEDLADDEVEGVEEEIESEDDIEDSEENAESSGPESDIEEAPAPKAKQSESVVPKEYLKLVSCGPSWH